MDRFVKNLKKLGQFSLFNNFRLHLLQTLGFVVWFLVLFGFLTSLSTTRLYRGQAPRQSVRQFYVLLHMRQSWETMTSVSAGHIILTPTQPVGSGRPQRELNPGPPHQESCALLTELPHPPGVCGGWSLMEYK